LKPPVFDVVTTAFLAFVTQVAKLCWAGW